MSVHRQSKSDMYCTECGQKNIPIIRRKCRERESGHLKRMFCIHCKKDVNMVEVNDTTYTYQLFKFEYDSHNFKDGNRVKPLNILKSKFLSEE